MKKIRQKTILIFIFLLCACATQKSKPSSDQPIEPPATGQLESKEQEMGPPLPPDGLPTVAPSASAKSLEPATNNNEGYVLVFGPGLARTFAYLGILIEFQDKQIPIKAAVGIEMGAMVLGVWLSSNVNQLEWSLYKFKKETLLDYSFFKFGNKAATGKKLYSFLESSIKIPQLEKMPLPFYVVSLTAADEVIIENQGSTKDVIRGAMSIPGVLQTHQWGGKIRMSAALVSPFPVDKIKEKFPENTKIFCVDVLGKGSNFYPKDALDEHLSSLMKSIAALSQQQIKGCTVSLFIPTDGISYLDFESREELVYRARAAFQGWYEKNIF